MPAQDTAFLSETDPLSAFSDRSLLIVDDDKPFLTRLARAMGVRQSPLEEVPSLALGTSPVTLKEMVAAYGTLANGGGYIEPVLITRIEDRSGQVLEEFAPVAPEAALDPGVAYTLLDVMREAMDEVVSRGVPPEAARDFFDTATTLAPGQANAYYGLAMAWEALGDLPMATGAMRSYLHLARAERPEHLARARAALWTWEQARRPDGAASTAGRELATAPAMTRTTAPAGPGPLPDSGNRFPMPATAGARP